MSGQSPDFQIGRVKESDGGWCCGKPSGCSMQHDSCLYLKHPWKRALRGEITNAERDDLLLRRRSDRDD